MSCKSLNLDLCLSVGERKQTGDILFLIEIRVNSGRASASSQSSDDDSVYVEAVKRDSKRASVCNSFAEDHKQKQESGSNAVITPQEFQLQFSVNEFRFGKAATNPRKLVGKRESGAAINLYMVPLGSRDNNVKQQRTSCGAVAMLPRATPDVLMLNLQ